MALEKRFEPKETLEASELNAMIDGINEALIGIVTLQEQIDAILPPLNDDGSETSGLFAISSGTNRSIIWKAIPLAEESKF